MLLIASRARDERAIDSAYRQRIGSNASLWYLPDTGHTDGLATHPGAYAAFLKAALASGH